MNITTTRGALRLLTAGSAALLSASLLAGCGGGGGNGNSGGGGGTSTGTPGTTGGPGTNTGVQNNSQIAGKVTDTSGRGIPGVAIAVDTGGQITNTISTGDYRLTNLSGNVAHRISASVTQGGTLYTGSTEVYTALDSQTGQSGLSSNGNILLSQANQQATVQGIVRDTSGKAIASASVYLSVPSIATAASSGNYSSLKAFTDGTGFYQIPNVPASLPTGSLLLTAATTAATNQNATISQSSVTPGSILTQNFTLTASTNAPASAPALGAALTFTQPVDGLTGSALQSRLESGPLSSGTVYEALRRTLSPSYAGLSARHRALGKRLASRAVAGSYAVETDILFNPPAATATSLLGYYVYQTTNALASNPVTENPTLRIDSLLDPLANYYTYVSAATDKNGPFLAGTAYNFALSALYPVTTTSGSGTATTASESALSNVVSVTPLSALTLNAPAAGATVISPTTISWNAVTGATKYYVFVYAQYPSINTATQFESGALSATTTSVAFTQGGTGTYYVVVVAAADETETAEATAPVTNAAQSYSEITQFTVR